MRGREWPGLKSKEIALAGIILALTLGLYYLIAFTDLPSPYFILILFHPLITRWIKGLLILATIYHIARYTVIISEFYMANNEALVPLLSRVDAQAARWIFGILSSTIMAYFFMGLTLTLIFLESGQVLILALEKVGYYRRLEVLREAFNL
jgi:hypothetical protein